MSSEVAKYSQLSSVAWVNSTWLILVVFSLVIINALPAFLDYKDGSVPLMVFLVIGSMVLAYPYIHYRVNGGFIKRVPPRFDLETELFSRKNI